MWENEVRGQKPACVPDNDAVYCFMQLLSQHQSVGQQITNVPLEKRPTRNTTRSCWIALGTMRELENCLKKLHRWLTRKRWKWAKQQNAEVNKLDLRSQLGRMWKKLLLEYFENEMSAASSAQLLMANPFTRTERHFFSRGSWLELHWKIWTYVTKWRSGTKACMCTGWWYSMLLHAAFESTPERRATNHKWSSWEGIHEEHCSFLVNSPGYDERTREVRGQKPACVPDNDSLCCFMQHLSPHQSFGH